MRTLEGHDGPVYSLAFTPDGACLASAGQDGLVHLWELGSPAPPRTLAPLNADSPRPVSSIATHPTQPVIAVGTPGGVTLWNIETNAARQLPRPVHPGVAALAYCDRGRHLVVGSGDRIDATWSGQLAVLNEAGTSVIQVGTSNGVSSVAATPTGKRILWGGGDRRVTRRDLTSPDQRMTQRHTREIRAIALNPVANRFAATDDYGIRLYDADSMQNLRQLTGHQGRVDALTFTPDGRFLVSAAWDKTVRFWDPDTGREFAAHDWEVGNVRAVAVSPDGLVAAAGGDRGTIVLWDVDL